MANLHYFECGIHVESNGTVINAPPGGTYRFILFDRWAFTSDFLAPTQFDVSQGIFTLINVKLPGVYMITVGIKWATVFPETHTIQIDDGWSAHLWQMNQSPDATSLTSTYQTASMVGRYPPEDFYPSHAGWPGGWPAQFSVGVGNNSGSDKALQATHNFIEIVQLDTY